MNWITLYQSCAHQPQRACLFMSALWMALAECGDWQRQNVISESTLQMPDTMMTAADRNSVPVSALARLIAQPY